MDNKKHLEDEQIIELFFNKKEGDKKLPKEAITETEKKYGRLCITIAYNILEDYDESVDCKNDSYEELSKNIPPHRPNNFKAYLLKIVKNKSIDMLRKSNTQKRGGNNVYECWEELEEIISSNTDVETITEDTVLRDCIKEFLRTLSEDNKKMFIRRYWYYMPIKTIAKYHGVSETTVKSNLKKTTEKLRIFLAEKGINV